jgi:hypothetical protein
MSGGSVKKAIFTRIPYISFMPEDGRAVSLLAFFDENGRRVQATCSSK